MSTLCWLRRDLRLHDHAALAEALGQGETTLVFIFDPCILDKLENRHDRRVTFIYQSLVELESELQKLGSSLIIRLGKPEEEIPKLVSELKVKKVFCNRDYEPYAKERDLKVAKKLLEQNIPLELSKDSVFFEQNEVLSNTGGAYKVFTPYKNKWLENFGANGKIISDFECKLKNLRKFENPKNILKHNWYEDIGFIETPPLLSGGTKEAMKHLKKFSGIIAGYKKSRDFPALKGTSLLSVYLRFGNISVRDMLRIAVDDRSEGSQTWLAEIIWRDFYQMILDTNPRIIHEAYRPEYDKIKFPGDEKLFKAWCQGQTGFPLVDAAMRCLNETGMMHNRLRMVVASFLCKTLLVHWRKGEAYFAEKLLDFDLAANNGGWQWSSGSGCDAQPYFRIFNPYTQSEKFDPRGEFIRAWVPELVGLSNKEIHHPDTSKKSNYPPPIVNYENSRNQCLKVYSLVKS